MWISRLQGQELKDRAAYERTLIKKHNQIINNKLPMYALHVVYNTQSKRKNVIIKLSATAPVYYSGTLISGELGPVSKISNSPFPAYS